jgi:hypothetical protein
MMLLHLFFLEQLEHIARLGDFGKIKLWLDLSGSGSLPGGGRVGLGRKVFPYPFSFVNFNGAGMCLLFRYANF